MFSDLTESRSALLAESSIRALLLVFFVVQGIVLYLVIFEEYGLLILVTLLVAVAVILTKPHVGLFLSIVVAYSHIAANILQGLYLPLVALTCFSWLIHFLNNKDTSLVKADQSKLLLLFGSWMLLSTFFAADLNNSLESIHFFVRFLVLFFLMINILDSWQAIRSLLWVLSLTGLLMIFYGGYLFFSVETLEETARLISFVEDPNSFAIKLIPLVAFSYILFKTEQGMVLKALSLFTTMTLIAGILMTFSRGGFLALLVVVSLIALTEIRSKSRLLVATILILVLALWIKESAFLYRFETISGIQKDVSVIQRLRILKGGLDMFLDHPLFGVGVGNFVTHSQDYCRTILTRVAHNSYLEVAAEMGLIGISLFLSLLGITIRDLRKCWKELVASQNLRRYYPLGILFALSGFATHSLFLSEQHNVALFIVIATTVAIRNIVNNRTTLA